MEKHIDAKEVAEQMVQMLFLSNTTNELYERLIYGRLIYEDLSEDEIDEKSDNEKE